MEELQLALTSARVDQRNFGLWINNWQIGQTLNALVTNQLPTGELVLRVGGQQITATADIPIQQGARLKLEVTQLDPVPTLRVLNPVASAAAANVGGTLQLLPGNASGIASPPLANVVQALQTSQAALPPVVADSIAQVLKQVSRPGQLSQPEALAAALRSSGIFLESAAKSSLSGRPPVFEGDFKAGLFRVLARVEEALSRIEALKMPASDAEALLEMKRTLEAGLGRVTLHQLNSQPSDVQASRHWQLEIPVQLGDSLHNVRLEIDRDGGGEETSASETENESWRVKLQIAPKALGALEILLKLQGDALGLRFAAESEGVRQLIDAGTPTLAAALESRGITLVTGPSAALTPKASPAEESATAVVDVRA